MPFKFSAESDQHKHMKKLSEAKKRKLKGLEVIMPDAYTGLGIVLLISKKKKKGKIMIHGAVSRVQKRVYLRSEENVTLD